MVAAVGFPFGATQGHIQRLNHQADCGVTVTASEQVLPKDPPALVGEEVALVAAMKQRPWFGSQASDQVLQIDALGVR